MIEHWMLLMALATVIIVFGCVLFDKPGWATLSLLITGGVANYFSDGAYWRLIQAHPSVSLIAVAIYIVVGVIWSFAKWYFFLLSSRDSYKEEKEKEPSSWFVTSYKIPEARDHKERILTWMTYWPISMIITLVDEPLRRAFLKVFYAIRGSYDRITAHVFRNVEIPKNGGVEINSDSKKPKSIKKVGP